MGFQVLRVAPAEACSLVVRLQRIAARPRPRPLPAYDGQSFDALERGLDPYRGNLGGTLDTTPDIDLRMFMVRDGYVVIGNGFDCVVVTGDGVAIEETMMFSGQFATDGQPTVINEVVSETVLDDVVVSCDCAWNNYYHWLLYGLGRSAIADEHSEATSRIVVPDYASRIAISQLTYQQGVYDTSIELSGLSDRLLKLPVGIYKAKTIRIVWTNPRLPTSILDVPEFDTLFARARPLIDTTTPRRILISRERAREPRMSPDAMRSLFEVGERLGYERLILEDLNFRQQVEAFRNATSIIAPHGAGLASLMFCTPGTPVLELNTELDNDGSLRSCFYSICNLRGLPYFMLNGSRGDFSSERLATAIERVQSAN